MGDISIIARRRKDDGKVEFGWGGNGGYFRTVGLRLLMWYNSPELVDYLFGMGEMSFIYKPYSENDSGWLKNSPTGRPHNISETERSIFSTIAFVDYGYFYDSDDVWYYIIPGPFRIKIPLLHICAYILEHGGEYEFDYLKEIEKKLVKYIFTDYSLTDPGFGKHLKKLGIGDIPALCEELLKEDSPVYTLWNNCYSIFEYFDDWVKVTTTDDFCDFTGFILKRKTEKHIETIDWVPSAANPTVHSYEELDDVVTERAEESYKKTLYHCLHVLMQEKVISKPEDFMEQLGKSPDEYLDVVQRVKEEFSEQES